MQPNPSTRPSQPSDLAAGFTNRLARAHSPYLLQHQHNPVDWYEWGPEALQRAKRENRVIFLSIGYSACHWCHVMAHESFENAQVAATMNAHFVNIKVDREERPDIDDVYMRATQMMNDGQGGWPMSVWLTPDLKPIFAGTYFPPDERWGRPGFRPLCERIAQLWRDQPNKLRETAEQVTAMLHAADAAPASAAASLGAADVDRLAEALAQAFDPVHGGMSGGGSNKFPPSMALDVMLRSAARRPADDEARRRLVGLATLTLNRMYDGGVYDQLAGGIHRYSTDVEWHVPHFEKMLYDQALVGRSYVEAYQFTRDERFAQAARSIFEYVLADLQARDGGFCSARDADSEGEEGRYYVWTKAEIDALLDPDDAALVCEYYDVSAAGNWRDPHDPGTPRNVLRVRNSREIVAQRRGLALAEFDRRLDAARAKLLSRRATRATPALDDKVICEWNGLMISALARGAGPLGEPKLAQAAARAADFLLTRQSRDGRLLRSWRDGRATDIAFLTDYACLIEALLDLYEATFERRWFDAAIRWNDAALRLFWDETSGGFYFTPHDHEALISRRRDVHDGATPGGNSVMLSNLLRMAVMTGDESLRARADAMIRALTPEVAASPWSGERFLCGIDFAAGGAVELAVVGAPSDPRTQALLRTIHATYIPNRVLMLLDPARSDDAPDSPLLKERALVGGHPAAYVCRNYACRLPATRPEDLARELER